MGTAANVAKSGKEKNVSECCVTQIRINFSRKI